MKLESVKEYFFYAFVFVLPWQTVFLVREVFVGGEKWQYGTVGVYASDLILALLLVMILVRTKINFQDTKNKKQTNLNNQISAHKKHVILNLFQNPKRILGVWFDKGILKQVQDDKIKQVIILFLIWTSVSIFWAPDKFLAAYFSLKMLLGVGFFFAIGSIKFDWKKLIFVLTLGALIQAGLGTWQYLAQDTFSSKWLGMSEYDASKGGVSVLENESGRWLRAYGAFPHPNVLGGYLVLTILIIVVQNFQFSIFNLKSIFNDEILKWRKVVFFALIIVVSCLLTVGLLFSFSRSAWVGLILGIVVFMGVSCIKNFKILDKCDKTQKSKLKNQNHNSKFKIEKYLKKVSEVLIVLAVFIAVIVGMNRENFFSRFDAAQRLEQKSVSDRVSYVSEAKEIISNNFLFGVGAGNYTLQVMKNDKLERDVWEYQPVHNVFLLILSELGIVGLTLFVLMLVLIINKAGIEAYPIFVALFVFMLLDHWIWTSHFGMLFFWVVLGLTCLDNRK